MANDGGDAGGAEADVSEPPKQAQPAEEAPRDDGDEAGDEVATYVETSPNGRFGRVRRAGWAARRRGAGGPKVATQP